MKPVQFMRSLLPEGARNTNHLPVGRLVWFVAWSVGLLAVLVLLGWMLNIEPLKRVFPGSVATNPLTALCLGAGALVLWCFAEDGLAGSTQARRQLGRAAACFMVLATSVKVVGLVGGPEVGLDQWLFPQKLAAEVALGFPNRMSPNAAIGLLLCGAALVLLDLIVPRIGRISGYLALAAGLIAFYALVGYLYGTVSFYSFASHIPMALPTAVGILLLALGILWCRPQDGPVALVSSRGLGSQTARYLLPAAILIPVLVGGAVLFAEKVAYLERGLGTSLFATTLVIFLSAVVLWTASTLNKLDEQRHLVQVAVLRAMEAAEQARLEAERNREIAEQANAARGRFLSRMSHELRTPLNAILGFGQIMEMDRGLTTDQSSSLQHILKGGRHLLGLVNEVLDISTIDAGKLALSVEPVLLQGLVAECEGLLRPLAEAGNVSLSNCVPPDACALADNQRLRQVLLNLMSNAIQYNHKGGAVTVGASRVEGAELVRLEVRDTGIGLDAESAAKVFQPFERLDADRQGVQGTGVGLTISQGLVELMGGAIGLQSERGVGTTFWLELPLASPPFPAVVAGAELSGAYQPDSVGVPGPEHTILCIEDNVSNLKLLEHIIGTKPGIRLLPAIQGSIGLELARKHLPQLILLDLHLPDISGQQVLAQLKGNQETAHIPVVILSADAMPHQIERLLAAGASAYLTKPLDVSRLLQEIDNHLLR